MSEWLIRVANDNFYKMAFWRRWFAWYPVVTEDGEIEWLKMLERRVPSQYWPQLGGWRPIRAPAKYQYRRAQEVQP